jgi:hypothetical protein
VLAQYPLVVQIYRPIDDVVEYLLGDEVRGMQAMWIAFVCRSEQLTHAVFVGRRGRSLRSIPPTSGPEGNVC